MEFHPKKCQVLNITNKKKPVKFTYTIHGHVLETVKSAKYLGVNIQSQLNWNTHVTKISSKANSMISFLQKNISEKALKSQKNSRINLWSGQSQNTLLQYGTPFKKMQKYWETRQERVQPNRWCHQSVAAAELAYSTGKTCQAEVFMFYKIVNNLVAVPAPTVRQPIFIRGYSHRYLVPFARTIAYQHSFYPDAIRLWNLACTVNKCTNCTKFFVFV